MGRGIAMIPLTIGFLTAGPIAGWLSDRFGARPFATGGMLLAALSFFLLELLPVNFQYWQFAVILFLNGLGNGMFASPNRAGIMNSLPPERRGVGAGMSTTFINTAMVLSNGIFFTLIVSGPGVDAARRPSPRPGRAGRAGGRRGPAGRAAAGVDPVRRAARLQPDAAAARSRRGQASAGPRRHPHRAHVPAVADLAVVPARLGHRV